VLFFTYGHVYDLLETNTWRGCRSPAPHPGAAFLLIFGIGVWWITRPKRKLELITPALNIVALAAVALPLLQIGIYSLRESSAVCPMSQPAPLKICAFAGMRQLQISITSSSMLMPADDILKIFINTDNNAFLEGSWASWVFMSPAAARQLRSNPAFPGVCAEYGLHPETWAEIFAREYPPGGHAGLINAARHAACWKPGLQNGRLRDWLLLDSCG